MIPPEISAPNKYYPNYPEKGITLTYQEQDWVDKAIKIVNNCKNYAIISPTFISCITKLKNFDPAQILILINKVYQAIQLKVADLSGQYACEKVIAEYDPVNHLLLTNNPEGFDWLIHRVRNIAHEQIIYRFSLLGLLRLEEVPLVLAAKMSNKTRANSIFSLKDNDINKLIDSITSLLENDTKQNIIKFQIIFSSDLHFIFGEFEIDKTSQPFTLKYLHFDTLPGTIEYNEIISFSFIDKVAPLAHIEIYENTVKIQKGFGCTYFAIDGALMQSVASKKIGYNSNLIEHMTQNGSKEQINYCGNDMTHITSSSLPVRFIRGMQLILDESEHQGLRSRVLDNDVEKNVIVNKNRETAETSIKIVEKGSRKKVTFRNMRMDNKRENYKTAVLKYLENNDILSPEFSNHLLNFQIEGLLNFCNQQLNTDPS